MLGPRVYIVDYEIVSPIGTGKDKLTQGIESNFRADNVVVRTTTEGIPFRKAAEIVDDLTPLFEDEHDEIRQLCKYDRKLELLAAAYELGKDRFKGLATKMNPDKTGVIVGVGADCMQFELFEEELVDLINEGRDAISEHFSEVNNNGTGLNLMNNPYDLYSIYLAEKFNAGKFQKSILTACVSSTQAVASAFESIKAGECDVVIAGGTDSLVSLVALISFGKLGVISESSDEPSCRPFDINRRGALAGESAGLVIMASENFVKKHHLKPIAEFLGYGNTLDAYKITAPDPEGDSMTKAIGDALTSSNLTVKDIDYINAHGTGTKHNDLLELTCIRRVFQDETENIPISSTKDRHGHAIAAAGIQELCVLLNIMENDIIPANLNLKTPCATGFDLVRENRREPIKYALTNNFSFGGINTVLAIKNLTNES